MPQRERKIIWEKWRNPLTLEGGDDTVEETERSYLEREADRYGSPFFKPKLGPVIASPMGIIPLTEHGDPAVVYDFWMMHTNFLIDDEVVRLGANVDGVESWNTFSPYRARVSFAKAFIRAEVMEEIQQVLGCGKKTLALPAPQAKDPQEQLVALKEHLRERYPFWAIFIAEDGSLEACHAKTRGVVEAHIKKKQAHRVITSWEGQSGPRN